MKNRIILSVVVAFIASFSLSSQGLTRINSTDLGTVQAENEKMVLLDVRTPDEFAQGHIKGAINIDIRQPGFYDKILALDKKATYMVYCRTQNRSGVTVNYMMQNGFSSVYQMVDGTSGWYMNKLPLER